MSEESGVKPAMSAEEWRHLEFSDDIGVDTVFAYVCTRNGLRFPPGTMVLSWNSDLGRPLNENARQALAALALHGQEYGFSWDDVDMLREPYIYLPDLADRIAALLPPREG